MDTEKIYNLWKSKKSYLKTNQNFSNTIIKRINQYEQKKRKPFFDMYKIIDFISIQPLAQVALFAAGAIAGFVRLIFVIRMVLEF
ncbi:MAG: hypothetical protein GWP06_19570 [Actinobacteria bacterium]|nr:hypothetical protein [Actinomycetota bacterium]